MQKVNKAKKIKFILSLIIGIIFIYYIIFQVFFIVVPSHSNEEIDCYGIIDVYLCNSYEKVTYSGDIYAENETHGDYLIHFSNDKNYNGAIYYYPAVDDNGKTTSETVLDGLKWMEKNNVAKVNISMSTKFYSSELEEWIKEHPQIQIYCSYNNLVNTYDYPAMYENVIGSGISKDIEYKDNDKKYHSNRIILFNKGVHFYKGNSFLSLNSLLGD